MDRRNRVDGIDHPVEPHEMTLVNRERLTMSGIKEVISFNEAAVILDTVQGPCLIKGENLNIQTLSIETGRLVVSGKIFSFDYDVKGTKERGLLKRLFK